MTDSKQKIAVIVVNYNSGDFLDACLDSLLKQTSTADRILVVDNNSDDGSADLISERYPGIELIRESENIGFAAANNHAIRLINDCQWVALLNPDAVASPKWLEHLRQGVLDHPTTQFFSCRLIDAQNSQLLDGTGDYYHVCGLVWRRDHGAPVTRNRSISDPVFSPCAAAALYDIDLIRRAGDFDESYFCYNEDIDLAFRMRLLGADCLHLDHCIVYHAGSGVTGSDSDFTVYHGHRNLVWTYFKNMPAALFWWYLPQHLILNIVSIFYYMIKGRPRVILKAKWDAIRGLPTVFRSRSQIQKTRVVTNQKLKENMLTHPLAPYFARNE